MAHFLLRKLLALVATLLSVSLIVFLALGAWGKTDSRSDTAGYTTSLGGMLVGVDGQLGSGCRRSACGSGQ